MRTAMIGPLAVLLLVGAAGAVAAGASEEPPLEAGLEREVRELNATLGQLVELLRRQLESSNAAVLMQRVQLMTSRIAPLEQELRAARAEQRGLENEAESIELAAEQYEAQLERAVDAGDTTNEEAREEMDLQLRMFASRQKQIRDRLWDARQRVIDLEQSLDARRAEIETWEGEIDRALGLR